ncbi:MAG: low-complexity tail membrane protein [Chroococcales cyanobacterium]
MTKWSEPYLWIHLAGLAGLPLLLEIVWLGLAAGNPWLPWLEFLLIAAVGIIPVLWIQWTRPFDIFSVLFVSLKPERLTEQQRRMLSVLKTPLPKIFSAIAATFLLILLWQLYQLAPVVAIATPLRWHFLGILLAMGAFLASNIFLQVPMSALAVLLTSEEKLAATEPYPVEKISQDFTVAGLRVEKILPDIVPEMRPVSEQTTEGLELQE